MDRHRFTIGQVVVAVSTGRKGVVIALDSHKRYQVFHDHETTSVYDENDLKTQPSANAPRGWAASSKLIRLPEFIARLTASRLASPLTDSIYALYAARVRFIPFQFKPLLRFLRADRPRLLIADDVGVGKTIEAGLILRELQARQRVQNVVIVCPKALVTKWRAEMRRFDEDFCILSAESLRYCLREVHLDGVWPAQYSRAIVHLELLRNPDYLVGTAGRHPRPGLLSLDPPPSFSLAIFDEAHHLRNASSNSHSVARLLCDNADAALFLSATPVQLGAENLFVLLNLLRPDLFNDPSTFRSMSEPTRHVNAAMRHVRAGERETNWHRAALEELSAALLTTWGRHTLAKDERLLRCASVLSSDPPPDDSERVRLLRTLEELHPFAHVINRTRRRDVGRFTIREPHTVSVPFTAEQEAFYAALMEFRISWLSLSHDTPVVNLILDMLERQVASCLPALLPLLDSFLDTGSFSPRRASDSDGDEDQPDTEFPEHMLAAAEGLRELAVRIPDKDPKADALLSVVFSREDTAQAEKTLVFSCFLHTLHYLFEKLRLAGVRVALICGATPDDAWGAFRYNEPTRSQLRERFRLPSTDPDAIDVLLSSEVGCEGLDYEFCDRLVNYDIPWNPMRLEQRIGRIDRFGQQSPKVRIFNFITPGTVEERIFFRCFERLGVFRDTVGDCEDVLGELRLEEKLAAIAHDARLSPEQAEEAARQVADNVIRHAQERERLGHDARGLLGLDHALLEEAQNLTSTDRCVSPTALRLMIEWLLAQPDFAGKLVPSPKRPGTYRLHLSPPARSRIQRMVETAFRSDGAAGEFRRWLGGDSPWWEATFDPATALEYREVAFMTPVHPLAQLAVRAVLKIETPAIATRLCVSDDRLSPGRYLVAFELWDTSGVRPESRLRTDVWSLNLGAPCVALSARILSFIENESLCTSEQVLLDQDELRGLDDDLGMLEAYVHDRWLADVALAQELNARLLARKVANIDAWHSARLARLDSEIRQARDPKILRMKTSQRSRIEQEQEMAREDLQHRTQADIARRPIGFVLMEVRSGN